MCRWREYKLLGLRTACPDDELRAARGHNQKPSTSKARDEQRRYFMVVTRYAPARFILVLYAMQVAPIHFVAPARELNIVFGVLLGGRLLLEEHYKTRLAGHF